MNTDRTFCVLSLCFIFVRWVSKVIDTVNNVESSESKRPFY